MTGKPIISISGLRGIVGEELTAAIAAEYACAFGTFLRASNPKKKKMSVCIGRDSRPSGQMLEQAVTEGLCSAGIDVVELGVVITPAVGIMIGHLQADGGAVITASHNPAQYNGVKLLLGDGIAPPADSAEKIKRFFEQKSFKLSDSLNCGESIYNGQADAVHIASVLAIVDKAAIAAKGFKIALDSVNGAGGPVAKKLLGELGCEVTAINDEPNGLFAHGPEPIAENLGELCGTVKKHKANIGFAQDPDGDRLAIVDENGNCLGEEYTLALAAKYVFSKKSGSAATNLSTSRMIDDIAQKAGCRVYRTAVGEANVAAAMRKYNCIIGGEGNGGIIDLRVGPVRNSLVGMVMVLQMMAESGKTISRLAGEIGSYYMRKEKFSAGPELAERIMDSAKKLFAEARIDTTDGCRFDFEDGWLHLRSSNTEPVMRVIAEAKDSVTVQKYINDILNVRKTIAG